MITFARANIGVRDVMIRNTREFGGYLRQAREDAGLTQAGLAKAIGVRRQRVLYLERGEGQMPLAMVFSIMRTLGVTLKLERTAEKTLTRKHSVGADAAPYCIDDIADGGTRG